MLRLTILCIGENLTRSSTSLAYATFELPPTRAVKDGHGSESRDVSPRYARLAGFRALFDISFRLLAQSLAYARELKTY